MLNEYVRLLDKIIERNHFFGNGCVLAFGRKESDHLVGTQACCRFGAGYIKGTLQYVRIACERILVSDECRSGGWFRLEKVQIDRHVSVR